jgi:hypothetical protein
MNEVIEKPQALRDRLRAFEGLLREVAETQGNQMCPVEHHWTPGVYAREMFIPAGWCVIGKVHKTETMAVLSLGHLRIFTAEEGAKDIYAGEVIKAKPGVQRAVYAFEDSRFVVFHPNPDNEKDVKVLEQRFVVDSIEQWEALCLTA